MPPFRYSQFCALARAAEAVGERWTLLIVRELLLGQRRFSDLKTRLAGVSPSVLSERLTQLEERGLLTTRELPPPAASTVYELTESGRALEPAMMELARWGMRFMHLGRPDDHFEPEWLVAGLQAMACRKASPPTSIAIRLRDGDRTIPVTLRGGRRGTRVLREETAGDVTVTIDGLTLLAVFGGMTTLEQAAADGACTVEGDSHKLADFGSLLDFDAADGTEDNQSTNARSEATDPLYPQEKTP